MIFWAGLGTHVAATNGGMVQGAVLSKILSWFFL